MPASSDTSTEAAQVPDESDPQVISWALPL